MTEANWITVVMPAYNVAGYVAEAMRSVAEQRWPAIHLVAIDDGSSDGTVAAIEAAEAAFSGPERSFELVRQANAGAGAARNAGLDRMRGSLVAFLDADDRWHPELLDRLAATLAQRTELDMTFPRYRYVDAHGTAIGVESRAARSYYTAVDLMIDNPVHSATGVVLRRSAAEAAGRFDATLPACIDLDFWVRIAALRPSNIGPTDAVLVDYRKREGQITGDWRRMERGWQRVGDKLAEAGHGLSPSEYRRGRARHCLFWSTIAYNCGDYSAARRLIAEAWTRDPRFAASEPLARIRTLASMASLLPDGMHNALRRRFNARRSG